MPKYNDRIITDGLPEKWHIQDRIDDNQALLCRQSDFPFKRSVCICTRPNATTTDEWLPLAQIIAHGFEAENNRRGEDS